VHTLGRAAADGRGRPRPDGQAPLIVARRASLGLAPVAMQGVFQIIAEIHKRGTTVLLVEQNATWL
jgi:ABC-type branched-subunit amino acid transport system ATPase component